MSRFAAFGSLWRALRAGRSGTEGADGVGDRLRAFPRLVWATVRRRYVGISAGRLAMILLAFGYVVSPVDLIPELFLPVVGLIDDAVVVAWLAGVLMLETERFLAWERAAGSATVVRGQVVR